MERCKVLLGSGQTNFISFLDLFWRGGLGYHGDLTLTCVMFKMVYGFVV